jgi:hypothetical protein
MGKSVNIYLDLKDGVFQTPRNNAVVQLFDYPATLSDGTIFGTQAVSSDGTVIVGYQSANRGRYHFRNVISGKYYTAVVSGGGITTFIPEGFTKLSVPQAPDATGTDIPWKDGEVDSLATKIESLTVGSSTGVNLGDGTGVFAQTVGSQFQFKTLKSGTNITISTDGSTITFTSAQDSTTNSRLSILEASDIIQDVEIADLTASDGTQNSRISAIENNYVTSGSNVGIGEGILIDKIGTDLRFKPLKQGTNITLSSDSTSITITGSASGEVNTASNLGSGAGVFAQKSGVDLQFKSLIASSDGTISTDSTSVRLGRVAPSNIKYVSPAFTGLGTPYYTTPALAVADAVSGDLIVVFPATYDGAGSPCITLKNGVNWYLHKGVVLTNSSGTNIHTVTDAGSSVTCTIAGDADITRITAGTGSAVSITGSATNLTLYANAISSSRGIATDLSPYSAGSFYVKVKSITGTYTSAGSAVNIVGNGTLEADTVVGTGITNSVIIQSAGTVYFKIKEVSTATASIRGIYMDNTGVSHIMCNRIKTTTGNPLRKDGGLMYLYGGLVLVNSSGDSITAGSAQTVLYYGNIIATNAVNVNITNGITGTSLINDTDVV